MQVIDDIVGNTVQKLADDGLLEDTFIFYFGDHGGVLPRGKGYAYESGLHVPLVVRIPKNFQHLVVGQRGDRSDAFVGFIDFGPTVLNLAGVEVPDEVDGRPFLGKGVTEADMASRDEAFGYADRFDEKYDLVRSLRKGRFQYIRCYQPWLPDGLMNIYRYKMLAYKEWQDLWTAGKLDGAAAAFYRPKPVEMLFDTEADPHEVHNLAADPAYQQTLLSMRSRLPQRLREMPVLILVPESELVRSALNDAVGFGQRNKDRIAQLLQVADLQLLWFPEAEQGIRRALDSEDAMQRYWGLMVCSAFGKQASQFEPRIRTLLQDDSSVVRLRAAEFLGITGAENPQPFLVNLINTTDDAVVAVEALNSVVYFRDFFGDKYPVAREDFDTIVHGGDVDDRLNYLNGIPYPKQQQRRKVQARRAGK
jgi:hypothetical protein